MLCQMTAVTTAALVALSVAASAAPSDEKTAVEALGMMALAVEHCPLRSNADVAAKLSAMIGGDFSTKAAAISAGKAAAAEELFGLPKDQVCKIVLQLLGPDGQTARGLLEPRS